MWIGSDSILSKKLTVESEIDGETYWHSGINPGFQSPVIRYPRQEEVHEVEGIGIGLYLACEIVTMQEGYIKVASTAGCGSTLYHG